MPKNENYIVIQGWMINELGLKGNELLIYALLYGFSQDEKSEFTGSLNYISKWLNIKSKHTVISVIDSLIKKGLVKKRPHNVGKVKRNAYSAITPCEIPEGGAKNAPVQKLHRGSAKNAPVGGAKIAPNTYKNKYKYISKEREGENPSFDLDELEQRMLESDGVI